MRTMRALGLLGLLLVLPRVAAAQPLRRMPIYVGMLAIVGPGKAGKAADTKGSPRAPSACTPDWEMSAVINKTLGQLGEEVQDWPTALPPERCLGVACAARLRGVVREGYLLGGQIVTQALGPAQLDLWLIDLAARRIMLARHSCMSCEKPELVARQLAAVVQRRTEPQAPWFPLSELTACAPSSEKLAPPRYTPGGPVPEVRDSSRPPILLAVYGAHAPERLQKDVSQGAKQYLELLGQPVQEFRAAIDPEAPRSALHPQQQAARLLDIELQASGRKLTGVLLRLSDAEDTRQTTFQCANLKDCTAAALVQQVRVHVGTLVDRLDTPPVAAADEGVEVCLPPPACVAELTK